jgi:hypothetical protein
MTGQAVDNGERSQATLALILGITSIACLPLLGPAAWAVARNELKGIDEGRRNPSNRRTAVAARVLGIVGTTILVAAVLLGLLALIVAGPEIIRGILESPAEDGLEAARVSLA